MKNRIDDDLMIYMEDAREHAFDKRGTEKICLLDIIAVFLMDDSSELSTFVNDKYVDVTDKPDLVKVADDVISMILNGTSNKKKSALSKGGKAFNQSKKDTDDEKKYKIEFINSSYEEDVIYTDLELYDVFRNAAFLAKKLDKKRENLEGSLKGLRDGEGGLFDDIDEANKVDPFLLLVATARLMPRSLLKFLKVAKLSRSMYKESFVMEVMDSFSAPSVVIENSDSSRSEVGHQSKDDVDLIINFSEQIIGKGPCLIVGMDDIINEIFTIFGKVKKRNVILTGKPGCGKTAIVEKLTYCIRDGKCPKEFEDYEVYIINVSSLIAGTEYRGQAEERFEKVKNFISTHDKAIIFIDEIHNAIGAGSCDGAPLDLANALKTTLVGCGAGIIGATTNGEKKYIEKDGAFARRFKFLEVEEPLPDEVFKMIKLSLDLGVYPVTATDDVIKKAIYLATCYTKDRAEPDRSLDFFDELTSVAKRLGKTALDEECFDKMLYRNFKMYKALSLENKRRVAVHEVGHYVLRKALNNTIYPLVAVTIIPGDNYLGANVYGVAKEESFLNAVDTYERGVNEIAELLGGREAERIYGYSVNSGSHSDYESATNKAIDMVTKYSLTKEDSVNRTFSFFSHNEEFIDAYLTETDKKKISKNVEEILKESLKLANDTIVKEKVFFDEIVEKVLEKGICDNDELEEIYKKTHDTEK